MLRKLLVNSFLNGQFERGLFIRCSCRVLFKLFNQLHLVLRVNLHGICEVPKVARPSSSVPFELLLLASLVKVLKEDRMSKQDLFIVPVLLLVRFRFNFVFDLAVGVDGHYELRHAKVYQINFYF